MPNSSLPVAALWLACYLAIAWTALIDRPAARAGAAALALAAGVFSAYLLYAQLVLIGAVCQWCVANDAVVGILCAVTLPRALASHPVLP